MPVVKGLSRFCEALRGHVDCYVLIGGGAYSVLLAERNIDFRATRDLDIVVLTDKAGASFARAFWSFIEGGRYRCGSRNDPGVRYYRFTATDETPALDYPAMVEPFAKHPDFSLVDEGSDIAPLPFDDDTASLSAIILDEGYYDFLKSGVTIIGGVPLLDTMHIIPLKMRAHIDLNDRSAKGEKVDGKDLRKHRADIVKLADLLPGTARLVLQGSLARDAAAFFEDALLYAHRITKAKDRRKIEEAIEFLHGVYL